MSDKTKMITAMQRSLNSPTRLDEASPASLEGTRALAPVNPTAVITLDHAVEQVWVEGRRHYAEELRAATHPGAVTAADYDMYLSHMAIEDRKAYWYGILQYTATILHSFKGDVLFIPSLEKKLAKELADSLLKSDPSIDDC